MKRFLLLSILITCFSVPSWAEPETNILADVDDNAQLRPNVDTDVDSAASPYRDPGPFAQRVRTNVIDAVIQAIEDNSNISDAEKRDTKQALRDLSRSGARTDMNSAASPYADLNIVDRPDGVWIAAVSILSIVLIFGTPIMLVAAVLYASHRKRRLASDMANRFLANGQQVPPEVWRGLAGDATPRSSLHKGVIMLGLGLGIFLCFWLIGSMRAAYLGLIPMFIGFAQLLIWKLEKRDTISGE